MTACYPARLLMIGEGHLYIMQWCCDDDEDDDDDDEEEEEWTPHMIWMIIVGEG